MIEIYHYYYCGCGVSSDSYGTRYNINNPKDDVEIVAIYFRFPHYRYRYYWIPLLLAWIP